MNGVDPRGIGRRVHEERQAEVPRSAALAVPAQEPGLRPARPVPYELDALGEVDAPNGAVSIHFGNTGKSAAVFQVRSGDGQDGPWTYTVGSQAAATETWSLAANGRTAYDLSVYGPNGFLRAFKGSLNGRGEANLGVSSSYDTAVGGISLDVCNRGRLTSKVSILDHYNKQTISRALAPGESWSRSWSLEHSFSWYDFTIEVESDPSFRRRLAGHVETGTDSMSDPAIGAS